MVQAPMQVAVLGLGAMGAGMAYNLHKAGLLGAAWNRGEARAVAFSERYGIPVAASAAAAVENANVVLSCVSRDEDVLALQAQLADVLVDAQVWVDSSTVSVSTAKTMQQRLQAIGGDFVDAPVSGGKEGAEQGTLAIMAGADEALFLRLEPLWQAIGQRWRRMGDVGAGQATKAVNQIMAAGLNQAVTEAMAFAKAQGLPIDAVVDVVGSGAAGNWLVNHRGESMVAGQFAPGFKLALHHKDLQICAQMAQAVGAPTAVIDATLADYQTLMAQGYGDEDISALYRLKR